MLVRARLILVVQDGCPGLSFRGCTWKRVRELGNGPSSVGPGVMDLVSWLEVWGVEMVAVSVVSYGAIFFSDAHVREVDGRAPVEIEKV